MNKEAVMASSALSFISFERKVLLNGKIIAYMTKINKAPAITPLFSKSLKKYTKSNELGIMFIAVDVLAVIMSFFVFDIKTGLFSALGLVGKSFIIDGAIESINLCKCFTIVCDVPEPICEYIINNLHRSATIYEAKGAFAHNKKTIILTTMKRSQAVKLRNYIKRIEPSSFMMITNSSEIIGKGFQNV